MFFYLGLYILELYFAVIYYYSKDDFVQRFFKFLCFLVLYIPASVRYNIGIDYKSYVIMFNSYSDYGEIGWHWIENLVRFLNLDVQWIFVVSSILIYGLLLKIKKKEFILLISLYFFLNYTESYNAVRNYISISIFIFSYYVFLEGRNKTAIVFCCLGFLFHKSTILFLPLLIVSHFITLKKKQVIVFAFLSMIIILCLDVATLSDLFSKLTFDFTYLRYLTSTKYGIKSGYFGLGSLLKWMILLLSYICCDERYCSKREFSAISIGFILLWISSMFFTKVQIFYRVTIVYSVVYLMIFRSYLYPAKSVQHLLGKIICFSYFFIFNFLGSLISNANGAIPYTSIWGK